MDVLTFIIVSFCVGHCYGQKTQRRRKLDRLQMKVDNLNDLATDLRLDIADLQSWRNATVARSRETSVIDSDVMESRLQGSFEKSLDAMKGRVSYVIKGLAGEKMALREMMEDCRAEVRHDIDNIRILVDKRITTEVEKCETKFKEERNNIETAFDAKLNQHLLTTELKFAEINEQFNRMSKQLETSRKNTYETLEHSEVVSNPVEADSTTVKDDTSTMKHQDEQYYTSMKQDGWLQYNNSLYKVFTERANFDTAVERCSDQNATLVEITTQEEWQFLSDNFKYEFWIGATDRQTEGEWRWLSGPLVKDGNWAPGEPNDRFRKQDCVVMGRFSAKYYDFPCIVSTNYVCKIQ